MTAPTPRYLGTTLAEAKTAFEEYVGNDLLLRVFDLDGSGAMGTADDNAFGRAVAAAETELDEILGASHGAPFIFANLTAGQQNSLRDCVARMVPFLAVEVRPIASTDEKGNPYASMYKRAVGRLAKLAEDNKRRLPGASAPAPTPRAGLVTMDDEDATVIWTNLLNGTTSGDF